VQPEERNDVVAVLSRLGGIAEWGELVGPCTPDQVRHAVALGRIVRLRRNRYALTDVDRHRAAAVEAGGVMSHLSAAVAWGWKVKHEPRVPWVTMARNRRAPGNGVEVRWADVADADLRDHVTRPARTVIDCARVLPFDEALAVADSALRGGEVGRHELCCWLPSAAHERAVRERSTWSRPQTRVPRTRSSRCCARSR
jgi:hypothetical protein